MPTSKDIELCITCFIKEEIHHDSNLGIGLDENIFTSGLVDSISIMRLIAHIETTYSYKIPPPDLIPNNFRTISIMTKYLHDQL